MAKQLRWGANGSAKHRAGSEGRYLFVIRAVSKSGQEDDFDGAIEIEIGDMLPDGVGSLSAVRV